MNSFKIVIGVLLFCVLIPAHPETDKHQKVEKINFSEIQKATNKKFLYPVMFSWGRLSLALMLLSIRVSKVYKRGLEVTDWTNPHEVLQGRIMTAIALYGIIEGCYFIHLVKKIDREMEKYRLELIELIKFLDDNENQKVIKILLEKMKKIEITSKELNAAA